MAGPEDKGTASTDFEETLSTQGQIGLSNIFSAVISGALSVISDLDENRTERCIRKWEINPDAS